MKTGNIQRINKKAKRLLLFMMTIMIIINEEKKLNQDRIEAYGYYKRLFVCEH